MKNHFSISRPRSHPRRQHPPGCRSRDVRSPPDGPLSWRERVRGIDRNRRAEERATSCRVCQTCRRPRFTLPASKQGQDDTSVLCWQIIINESYLNFQGHLFFLFCPPPPPPPPSFLLSFFQIFFLFPCFFLSFPFILFYSSFFPCSLPLSPRISVFFFVFICVCSIARTGC